MKHWSGKLIYLIVSFNIMLTHFKWENDFEVMQSWYIRFIAYI